MRIPFRCPHCECLLDTDALDIARKIAQALAYAWDEHRMIHRDVNPGDVPLPGPRPLGGPAPPGRRPGG